jgi:hypothetical protein
MQFLMFEPLGAGKHARIDLAQPCMIDEVADPLEQPQAPPLTAPSAAAKQLFGTSRERSPLFPGATPRLSASVDSLHNGSAAVATAPFQPPSPSSLMMQARTFLDYCGGVDGRARSASTVPQLPRGTSYPMGASMTPLRQQPPLPMSPPRSAAASLLAVASPAVTAPVAVPQSPMVLEPPPQAVSFGPLGDAEPEKVRAFLAVHPAARLFGRATFLAAPFRTRHRHVSRVHLVIEHFATPHTMSAVIASRDRWHRVLLHMDGAEERAAAESFFEARLDMLTSLMESSSTKAFALLTAVGNNPVYVNDDRVPPSAPVLVVPGDVVSILEPATTSRGRAAHAAAWIVRERSPSPQGLSTSRRRSRGGY